MEEQIYVPYTYLEHDFPGSPQSYYYYKYSQWPMATEPSWHLFLEYIDASIIFTGHKFERDAMTMYVLFCTIYTNDLESTM